MIRRLVLAVTMIVSICGWRLHAQAAAQATQGSPQASVHQQGTIPPASTVLPILYDQMNNAGGISTSSQDFETANDAFDTQIADDFVIPVGQTWSIQRVEVTGVYFNGAGPAASVHVFIYPEALALTHLPSATPECSYSSLSYTGGASFVVDLPTPCVLSGGVHWVSVQARQDFTPAGQWGWTNRTVQSNSGAAFQNPGGGFGFGCTTWDRRTTCVTGADGEPDQMFRLSGTSITSTSTAGGLLIASGMTLGYGPNGYTLQASNTEAYAFSNSHPAANQYAIFQTHDPWDDTVLKTAITNASHTYSVFTPAQLAGFAFSDYRVVILNWDDHFLSDFLTPYTESLGALQAYVEAGGVLWVQAAIQSDSLDTFSMPFGGTEVHAFVSSDFIADPTSRMMQGISSPIAGDFASHAHYSNLPAGAHVVVKETDTNGPPVVYALHRRAPYDTNHDTLTDRTVFRPSTNTWYTALSGGGATATEWGTSGDIDVMGDYDGDGKADVGVFRPSTGTWYIVQSSDGVIRTQLWGVSGDLPLAGDVDGDGKADLVIYRNGAWYALKSGGGTTVLTWGLSTDQPLLEDLDGDGKADFTVFRPSTGTWWAVLSAGGTVAQGWGTTGDVPVAGNWDGDARADLAVFRPSTGQWFIVLSTGGTLGLTWGVSGDVPVSGDWDADGKSDFTIFRPSNGTWYTQFALGGFSFVTWGTAGDGAAGRRPGS